MTPNSVFQLPNPVLANRMYLPGRGSFFASTPAASRRALGWGRAWSRALAAGAMAAAACSAVQAQSQAAAPARPIVVAKVSPLPLFDSAGAGTPIKTVVALGFPWAVLEDKADFYRVHIDGQDYWVDSMDVRTAPAVKAKCTLGSADRKQPVGATMGAGANPCATP